jgi:transcriptional regulator with XRE-family HTH domain
MAAADCLRSQLKLSGSARCFTGCRASGYAEFLFQKEAYRVKDRIKAIRTALKLSQREFGERLGVSRDVISNLEYGRVQPKELLLKHICKLYGVNEEWLLRGEGEMFAGDPPPDQRAEEALRIFQSLRPEFQDYALEQIRNLVKLQGNGKAGDETL